MSSNFAGVARSVLVIVLTSLTGISLSIAGDSMWLTQERASATTFTSPSIYLISTSCFFSKCFPRVCGLSQPRPACHIYSDVTSPETSRRRGARFQCCCVWTQHRIMICLHGTLASHSVTGRNPIPSDWHLNFTQYSYIGQVLQFIFVSLLEMNGELHRGMLDWQYAGISLNVVGVP